VSYGLGYRKDLENRARLLATQVPFVGSNVHLMRYSGPVEIDPRKTTTIVNQLQKGSCSGASRVEFTERLNQIQTGDYSPLDLSIDFCYLTNQKHCGCFGADNGATIDGSMQAFEADGACHSSLMPPYTSDYIQALPAEAIAEGKKHTGASHSQMDSYDTVVKYIQTAGVVQVGIDVGDAFMSMGKPGSGGVYTLEMAQADHANPEGGHAQSGLGLLLPQTVGMTGSDLVVPMGMTWGKEAGDNGWWYPEREVWDYWFKNGAEIWGASKLTSFGDPEQAIDFKGIFI
jgi:hypothetical protein